ncbi:hypothetical protein [Coprobacter fastidiosus]|jgi:mercuric ion binding protein|uniref:hypothetical protein n=1 Tax=Coprobacter fastidiosus TaxID=1099853 RepID=UPI003C6C9856
MKAKRFTAVLVMALLSVTVIVAKDLRIVVFKVPQMYCEPGGTEYRKQVDEGMRKKNVIG